MYQICLPSVKINVCTIHYCMQARLLHCSRLGTVPFLSRYVVDAFQVLICRQYKLSAEGDIHVV